MLRDPIDRVVSHYHYVMTNPSHYLYKKIAGGSFTLHDYAVTRASHELDNDQVRWLCAQHHFDVPVGQVSRQMVDEAKWNLENAFAVVGIMERFHDSLECLRAAFGWQDVAPESSRNVNKSRPRLRDIPQATLDAIRQVGPGAHFLGCDHTQANFESAFYRSPLADNNSYEQWLEGGSLDMAKRANALWKKQLAEYVAPPLDPAIDEALLDFINRRKAAAPDSNV